MSYKRLIPCIFIYKGKAIKWFDDKEVVSRRCDRACKDSTVTKGQMS